MSSVISGQVVPSAGGLVLTFQNTGSYSLPFVSQILSVNDADGNLLYGPFNMGQNLSQAVDITGDAYLSFVNVIQDQTGVLTPIPVNYEADGVYTATFLQDMVALGCCGSKNNFYTLMKAELNWVASQRFALSALGVNADTCITNANILANSITGQ